MCSFTAQISGVQRVLTPIIRAESCFLSVLQRRSFKHRAFGVEAGPLGDLPCLSLRRPLDFNASFYLACQDFLMFAHVEGSEEQEADASRLDDACHRGFESPCMMQHPRPP